MKFTAYSAVDGRVLYSGDASDLDALGVGDTRVLAGVAHGDGWISDGAFHPMPERPNAHYAFDWTAKAWFDPRTLGDLKAERWEAMKRARAAMEFGPFTWDGSTFDGDSESQARIQGAAQLATLAQATGQPFAIDWTLADDSTRTLSALDMIAVGMAMGTQIATAHAIGRAVRQQINAATSAAQLEAITWPAA